MLNPKSDGFGGENPNPTPNPSDSDFLYICHIPIAGRQRTEEKYGQKDKTEAKEGQTPGQSATSRTYANGKLRDVAIIRHCLSDCADHLRPWCVSGYGDGERRIRTCLYLAAAKWRQVLMCEIIWFGSHTNLRALAGQELTLPIGSDFIQGHCVVRDLDIFF
jgi:hypothetical protein